jgi:hypothetical protein
MWLVAQEGGHDLRIKLTAGLPLDLGQRLIGWPSVLVGPVMGEGVVDIGNGDDPGGDRDRFATKPVGVSVCVPAFVV